MPSKLRQIRQERGWSQIRLSAYTMISQGDLSKIERGKLQAGPTRRRRIARALGVEECELFRPATDQPAEAAQ